VKDRASGSSKYLRLVLTAVAIFSFSGAANTPSTPQGPPRKALTVDDYSRRRSISEEAISAAGTGGEEAGDADEADAVEARRGPQGRAPKPDYGRGSWAYPRAPC